MARKKGLTGTARTAGRAVWPVLGAVLFFFAVCLGSAGTVKSQVMLLILAVFTAAFLFWERLRDRLKLPVLVLAAVVLMDFISCAYAASRKFALQEFMKVMTAFCLVLLFLALLGTDRPERRLAAILEGFAAVAGLVSIDLLSTRWISTPVLTVLGWFTNDYLDLDVVEEGVRMTSVLMYPNTFAFCMGTGVLLGLGLTVTSQKTWTRTVHLICLAVNALSFVLAFSLGATIMILPAFLALLVLTGQEERTGVLILMVETLAVTLLAAFPISMTSMTAWDGFRPIPLLCTIAGTAALCALDLLAGRRLSAKLAGHGRAALALICGLLGAAVVFVLAACSLTTGATLQAGESLRRSVYPQPGQYTVNAVSDGEAAVTIDSQNRQDTVMHTSTQLYSGPLAGAEFTVPEDSLVVWFRFSATDEVRLDSVEYTGSGGSGSIPLHYRLLPGFVANRLQGLWVNQNAIQRFAFFEDGLKLFRGNPVLGRGMGGYANGVLWVQSFFYYTKYAHNHYVQALADTGIVGLALYLALLAVSAAAVWRGRKRPLAPALGAAVVFIACHSAVDGICSYFASMPMVFAVFAAVSLGFGDTLPMPAWAEKKAVRNALAVSVCVMLAVFEVLLCCNAAARNIVANASELDEIERAAALDPFEGTDHMLTYVVWTTGEDVDPETRAKADEYAARLGELESNSIPLYLAEYYLDTGRMEQGFEQLERYVRYISAYDSTWEKAFRLLEEYEQDTPEYRAGVIRIADIMDEWNNEHMGHVEMDEQARAFVERMRT